MRRELLVCFSFLCLAAACSSPNPARQNRGLHTVDGVVPLYVDGGESSPSAPTLSPALLAQVRTASNLGDALRTLGPAYASPNDPLRIPRWHFSDGTTLTLWPRGGETLADAVSVYPHPNCNMPAYACKDLVLGREKRDRQTGGNDSDSDPSSTITAKRDAKDLQATRPGSGQSSTSDKIEQGLVGTFLQTTNAFAAGLTQRAR
jgi:hypothetical protein